MTDLHNRIARLSPSQRALLARRLQTGRTEDDLRTPIGQPLRLVAYAVPNNDGAPDGESLRQFISEQLPDYMTPSTFVLLDELPRLPNGKVDRSALPEPDEAIDRSDAPAYSTPRNDIESLLVEIWSEVLGIEAISVYDNFFELGGDSILSIQIIAKAAQQDIKLTPTDIFQHPTVAALARVATVGNMAIVAQQTEITGTAPLTPIQHWFFEQQLTAPDHWNQSYLLEVGRDVDLRLIEQSLQKLFWHHDALRLRFVHTETGWSQEFGTAHQSTMPVFRYNLAELDDAERQSIRTAAVEELHQGLELASGRLTSAGIFDYGPGQPAQLLLVIHHLAVDGISWQILLEDLETGYRQLQQGQAVELPPKTTSFQRWANLLTEFAQSSELDPDLRYWLGDRATGAPSLAPDYPIRSDENIAGATETVTDVLSAHDTDLLLQQVPKAYHTHINDTLLSALVLAFAEQTGESSLFIDLEGHGREDLFEGIDISRTVSWFTTVFPLRLELHESTSPGAVLSAVKEQLREIPRKGLSYGLLRYLCKDGSVRDELSRRPNAQITFNYMGQFDHELSDFTLFKAASESVGTERNPYDKRRYLLDINSYVEQGQLMVKWAYCRDCFHPSTIEGLANGFIRHLRAIIEHCTTPGVGGYTPSDFQLADLDSDELGQLANLLDSLDSHEGDD